MHSTVPQRRHKNTPVFEYPHLSDQLRIYDELVELIGRGTADLYNDACELRNDDARPCTAGLLVGHLFREVDSAVRAALRPCQRSHMMQ
jgi:hypothetical protein